MRKKKAIRLSVASAIVAAAVLLSMAVPLYAAYNVPVNVEAEDCNLGNGAQFATDVYGTQYPGYSGDGFVWVADAGPITFEVNIPDTAVYKLSTRCWMYLEGDDRLQVLSINGERKGAFYIPNNGEWIDYSFGFFYLKKGKATIEIGSAGQTSESGTWEPASWGYILYDTVSFDYADIPDFRIDPMPCDPKATSETKALKQYLTSVYGKKVISGQQEVYGNGHKSNYELEFEYIHDASGKYPAIRGFDLMNYNPLYGWEDGSTDRIIKWTKQRGGIATVCWHINVPLDFNSYRIGDALDWAKCTYKPTNSFNTANCLKNTTKEHAYLMLIIEDLAEQLLILQDNDVPVILRPFHEAQGNAQTSGDGAWFWWGTGGADVYKDLWKLLYTTLTEEYGLHNLLWEVNLYSRYNSFAWYPGDEYVDIVAFDKYEMNTDSKISDFLTLVEFTNDTKMVAMSENDMIPDIENIAIEGAWWLYFCPWYFHGEQSTITDDTAGISGNGFEYLKKIYQNDHVITLNNLPADLYGYTPTTTPTPTPVPTITPTPDPGQTPPPTPTIEPSPTPGQEPEGCDGDRQSGKFLRWLWNRLRG